MLSCGQRNMNGHLFRLSRFLSEALRCNYGTGLSFFHLPVGEDGWSHHRGFPVRTTLAGRALLSGSRWAGDFFLSSLNETSI